MLLRDERDVWHRPAMEENYMNFEGAGYCRTLKTARVARGRQATARSERKSKKPGRGDRAFCLESGGGA
jgi:hypothetical protein